MELQEFLAIMDSGKEVIAGSETHRFMCELSQEAIRLTTELNSRYHTPEEIVELMRRITGREIDPSFSLFPPFTTGCGKNLKLGKNVFFNSGVRIQDQGGVTIDDGALIGHNVMLATLNHNMDPRRRGNLLPAPIHIGKNVWIGANAVICPGVTIGDGAVVAAGAVVNADAAPNTVVGGVPAKWIRDIELPEEEPVPLSGVPEALKADGRLFKEPISGADLSKWLCAVGLLDGESGKQLVPTERGISAGLSIRQGRRRGTICCSSLLMDCIARHVEDILECARGNAVPVPADLPEG